MIYNLRPCGVQHVADLESGSITVDPATSPWVYPMSAAAHT